MSSIFLGPCLRGQRWASMGRRTSFNRYKEKYKRKRKEALKKLQCDSSSKDPRPPTVQPTPSRFHPPTASDEPVPSTSRPRSPSYSESDDEDDDDDRFRGKTPMPSISRPRSPSTSETDSDHDDWSRSNKMPINTSRWDMFYYCGTVHLWFVLSLLLCVQYKKY